MAAEGGRDGRHGRVGRGRVAVAGVEKPYPSTAAGLTMVIGWGLPFFRTFVPSLMDNGINARIRAHRQNYLIPPRRHRSLPLVELLS
jgi:hypothetical protein